MVSSCAPHISHPAATCRKTQIKQERKHYNPIEILEETVDVSSLFLSCVCVCSAYIMFCIFIFQVFWHHKGNFNHLELDEKPSHTRSVLLGVQRRHWNKNIPLQDGSSQWGQRLIDWSYSENVSAQTYISDPGFGFHANLLWLCWAARGEEVRHVLSHVFKMKTAFSIFWCCHYCEEKRKN